MAQNRTYEYRADDDTLTLNNWKLGVLNSGRTRGFDFVPSANLTLTLNHQTTGKEESIAGEPPTLSNKKGSLVTGFGVVIKEDESISLAVATGDLVNPRWDTVYCEHEYQVGVTGGVQAVYKIETGTPDALPTKPNVPNSITDTIIGWLYIPANTTQLDQDGVEFVQKKTEYGDNVKGKDVQDVEFRALTGSTAFEFDLKSGVDKKIQVFSFASSQQTTLDITLNEQQADNGSVFELFFTGEYNRIYATRVLDSSANVLLSIPPHLLQDIQEGDVVRIVCTYANGWVVTGDRLETVNPDFLPSKGYVDGEIVQGIVADNELQLKAIGDTVILNDGNTIGDDVARITFLDFTPKLGQKLRIACGFTTPTTLRKFVYGYGPGGAGDAEDYDIDMNRFASFNVGGIPELSINNNRVFDFQLSQVDFGGSVGIIKLWQLIGTTAINDYVGVDGRVNSPFYPTLNAISAQEVSHHQAIVDIDEEIGILQSDIEFLEGEVGQLQSDIDGYKAVTINIGGWNMDSDAQHTVLYPAGVTPTNIRLCEVTIFDNNNNLNSKFEAANPPDFDLQGHVSYASSFIRLTRKDTGKFDDPTYNDLDNRGEILIHYKP